MKNKEHSITYGSDEKTYKRWVGLRGLTGKKAHELGKEAVEMLVQKYGDPIISQKPENISKDNIEAYIQKMVEKKLEELLK